MKATAPTSPSMGRSCIVGFPSLRRQIPLGRICYGVTRPSTVPKTFLIARILFNGSLHHRFLDGSGGPLGTLW